ncbi:LysM peptidoglycan-binding domain-containing protein [Salipaludibacillus sp. CUR1]|uniref:muramidase family protein n=1 Tax=Salipaludibacillus sp. CUR1 TaxID=2820003 RepID=UPI001E30D7AF|nr:LysM peptidoglycan-binding domain-containing protein [Salipaludibacillus sp. CUR1]MCE7791106.1 LysM peptidoglycan-binding domain-containing protein [Salipaludibacillus sp. CUR1]
MNQETKPITRSRKQRLFEERSQSAKRRKAKIACCALAGTFAAGSLFTGGKTAHVNASEKLYTVQQGDTLSKLAVRYNVSVEQLMNVNSLSTDLIIAGSELTVPGELAGTYKYVTVKKGDSLRSLANANGLTVTDLKRANGLTSSLIYEGQKLRAPLHETVQSLQENKHNDGSEESVYDVVGGDTLFGISQKFQTTVSHLKRLNGLTSDRIFIGEKLLVPSAQHTSQQEQPEETSHSNETKGKPYKVIKGDTLPSIAENYAISVNDIIELNIDLLKSDRLYEGQILTLPIQEDSVQEQKTDRAIYTVAPGDTLWGLARRFNLSVEEIKEMNGLENDFILIGQELVIKSSNLVKSEAELTGAVDRSSVEFAYNDTHIVLEVPFGMAEKYEDLIGEKVTIVFQDKRKPALVSIEV